jgi:hypothetical protein
MSVTEISCVFNVPAVVAFHRTFSVQHQFSLLFFMFSVVQRTGIFFDRNRINFMQRVALQALAVLLLVAVVAAVLCVALVALEAAALHALCPT